MSSEAAVTLRSNCEVRRRMTLDDGKLDKLIWANLEDLGHVG